MCVCVCVSCVWVCTCVCVPVCACVCVSSGAYACGGCRLQVLVFDHFEEVRQVLQTSSSSSGETDGAVTAIDVSRSNDYLVCGYLSGRIVLWDILRGHTLKSTTEMHSSPVTSVKFVKCVALQCGCAVARRLKRTDTASPSF